MNVFIAKAKDKGLAFKSPQHTAMFKDWLYQNDGKEIRIELAKNPVSDNLRAWYFAGIIPTVKSAIYEWKDLSDDEVHEILKKQFEYFDAYNTLSKRVERFGRSVMGEGSNTERAMAYIAKIQEYFLENYKLSLITPEEFKASRDNAELIYEKSN